MPSGRLLPVRTLHSRSDCFMRSVPHLTRQISRRVEHRTQVWRSALAARVPVRVRRQFSRIRMQFLHSLHGERSLPG